MRLPRLNIGAGRSPKSPTGEYLNCDLYPGENIDVVFDACTTWPFKAASIGAIESHHCFEHLPNVWTFMREAWRVLTPSQFCNFTLRLPYGPGPGGIGDITHVRPYLPGSFCCFQPGYNDFVKNPQHDAWDAPFSIMSIYVRVNPRLRWLVRPIIRHWGLPALEFLWDGFVEMIVGMRALKSPQEVQAWKQVYTADVIPIVPCMYEHEYKNRPLAEGEQPQLRFFGPSAVELHRLQQKELNK